MSTPPPARDPFELCGVTIDGKYRVASVVGDGGFGVVYRGVHKGFGELIAVKCLKLPNELETEEEREALLERLRDEGRLLHRLSKVTSGIVQALDVGATVSPSGKWIPYLVLEWLEGETLGSFMKKRLASGQGGLSLREAIELLEPAARALAIAHGQNVAHRDVKPANLFVTEVGGKRTVKVLDFGIAKVLSSHTSFTTALEATGTLPAAFTPRYGAPEQFNKNRGASGPWTDVFALALILVEIVSGKRALDGDDPTQLYVASADPMARPTLRSRGVEVTEDVERVLARALEVEPRHRYPDAGAFWDALLASANGDAAGDSGAGADGGDSARTRKDQSKEGRPAEKSPTSVGPTVPVESLRVESSKRSSSSKATPPADASNRRGEDDPMAETPPERRRSAPSHPDASPTEEEEEDAAPSARAAFRARADAPKKASPPRGAPPKATDEGDAATGRSPWLWVSLLVLGGGAAFAYTTLAPEPKTPRPPASRSTTGGTGRATQPPPPPAASGEDPVASASVTGSPDDAGAGDAPELPEDMVLIAAGEVTDDGRTVAVAKDFLVDRYEVTVRAYRECKEDGACTPAERVTSTLEDDTELTDEYADVWNRRCNEPRGALDHPVNCVSFSNAAAYCKFRGRRLPTEAEWELAARGPSARPFPWGKRAPSCEGACFDRNEGCLVVGELVATCAGGTHPSDRTPEGLYDLGGNVAEWVAGKGGTAVIRGGSFLDAAENLRATNRRQLKADDAHVRVGFRCALDAPEAPPEPAPGDD